MCDFAVMIGVRGTGAAAGTNLVHNNRVWTSGGMGSEVAAVRSSLIGVPDMPFYFLGLNYPATSVLAPSIQDGVSKLQAEINYISQTCPYAPVILVGHSQGASVISNMLTGVNTLTPAAKESIKDVILFGDPYYNSGKVTNYPNRPNNGLFSQIPYTAKNPLANYRYWGYPAGSSAQQWIYRVREYCNIGDYFCQSNPGDSNFAIHNAYDQYASSVAGWIQYTLTNPN